jgi:hypothetical protein
MAARPKDGGLYPHEITAIMARIETGSVVKGYLAARPHVKAKGDALHSNAKKFFRRPAVAARYREEMAKHEAKAREIAEEKHGVTVDMIMKEHKKIGFASMRDFVEVINGRTYTDLTKLTPEQWACIREVDEETVLSADGEAQDAAGVEPGENGKRPKVAVLKTRVKLYDKHTSLVEMGKHLGMYAEDNKQKGEAEARALEAARARGNDDLARRLALILAAGARKAAKAPSSSSAAAAV